MADHLALYGRLVGSRVRSQLQYRTSFALSTTGSLLGTFLDFLAIAVIFTHLPALEGWSLHEVAFLYGTAQLSFSVTDLLIGHFDRIGAMIRTGEMDVVLVRPMGTLFQIASADFQLRRIGKTIQAAGVLAYAVSGLDVTWSAPDLALLAATLVGGTVIFSSVWIAGAALAFWTTESTELNNAFTYGGSFLTSYPLEIYGVWLRRILALAVPMAFVNYFPALHLLERDDALGWPDALRFAAPLVAVVTAAAAGGFWRLAVRHYRSTGS